MMRYRGASDEQMMSFEDSLRRWGQGSVHCGCCRTGATCLTSTISGFELTVYRPSDRTQGNVARCGACLPVPATPMLK
jgi:hypothetical protein